MLKVDELLQKMESIETDNDDGWTAWCELKDWLILDDGFGSSVSAWCPKCHEKTMYVNRPGDFRCANCE